MIYKLLLRKLSLDDSIMMFLSEENFSRKHHSGRMTYENNLT